MAGTLVGLDYALLDIGDGRRLERFGSVVVDRPCPPAEGLPRTDPAVWQAAHARFDRATDGQVLHAAWTTRDGRPIEPWTVVEHGLRCQLRLAPSGQVGVFPEQAVNRAWVRRRVERIVEAAAPADPVEAAAPADPVEAAAPADPVDPAGLPSVLNLFAYTGLGTLAAVTAGAAATHVDAARATVAWARHNADLNGFGDRPIRWIADDAMAFVRREARRGRRYAGIVLDPPSYGHGPGGRDWRLERDLPALLAGCAQLVEERSPAFVLLTAHTPGADGERLADWLDEAMANVHRGGVEVGQMVLHSRSGERLPLGWSARWTT